MKCFVTGATGFVGGHLCERLVRDGNDVIALVRPGSKRHDLAMSGVHVAEGDMNSVNVFAQHAEEAQVVFHLAAITKAVRKKDFARVNTDGTANLVAGLVRGGFAGRVVLLSSLAAGGPAEDEKTPRTEGDPDAPVSAYGQSKLDAEAVLRKGLPASCSYAILRPGAIYGPREHEIYEVLKLVRKHGRAVRFGAGVHVQMTHVEDVVDGLVRMAFQLDAAGANYYINDERVWTFDQIISLAARYFEMPVKIVSAPIWVGNLLGSALDLAGRYKGYPLSPLGRDKMHEIEARFWHADSTLMRQETGWAPKWTFEEGFPATMEWYRKKGML